MQPDMSQLTSIIKPEINRSKETILTKKDACDAQYKLLIKELIRIPALPKTAPDFITSIIDLFVELQSHIPLEKKQYIHLEKLLAISKEPDKLTHVFPSNSQASMKALKEYIGYYLDLLEFMHDVGITKVEMPRTNGADLLVREYKKFDFPHDKPKTETKEVNLNVQVQATS